MSEGFSLVLRVSPGPLRFNARDSNAAARERVICGWFRWMLCGRSCSKRPKCISFYILLDLKACSALKNR